MCSKYKVFVENKDPIIKLDIALKIKIKIPKMVQKKVAKFFHLIVRDNTLNIYLEPPTPHSNFLF